jgi:eukaryotic-like serine/threonine-protein kinase
MTDGVREAQGHEEHRDGRNAWACAAASARGILTRIGDALRDAIIAAAPSIQQEQTRGGGWSLRLGRARLSLSSPERTGMDPWRWEAPALDVICHAALDLSIPADQYQYEGRSHSLWFCDAETAGEFAR